MIHDDRIRNKFDEEKKMWGEGKKGEGGKD